MRDDCSLIAWIHEIIDSYKQNHLPDTAMSDTSENLVQNKVIKKYVDEKEVKISKEPENAVIKYADGLYVEDKAEQLSNMRSIFENTVAGIFSEEKDYHIGEYVVHENRLYRFTGEKSAGPWDGGKAVEGSLMDEVNAIRDKTDLLQGSQGDYSVSVSKELQQLHQIDEENQYLHDHVEFNDYTGGGGGTPPPEQTIDQITSGKSIQTLHQLTKVALKGLLELAQNALSVALGKNQAKVFDTVDDLDNWLKVPANLNTLSVGDHFYIKETDVPDYWWDGTQKQNLETQKVDLVPYDQSISELKAKDAEITNSLNSHVHDDRYYTETEIDTKLSGKSNTGHDHAWGEITGKPTSFTPSDHNHDERYYTETEVDGKLDLKSNTGHDHTWGEITGKPEVYPSESHNHDDRYYTETEINGLLNGKANSLHSHDDQYYTQEQLDLFLLEKSDVDHEHSWDSILGKPETIPPSEHDHDTLYYRKSELDDALAGKSNSFHDHNDLYYTQTEVTNLLADKASVSHTHNYAASIHTHDDRYYTESEVNNKLAAKAEAEHTHVWADITDKPTTFTPSTHTHTEYAASSHTHDDRYYTETEVNTKLDGKSNTNHTHNYAASASAGGSATSAVKLDSNAGSATQPVYFSGGKPVACTYTLGKSVPANAVFTDKFPAYKRIDCPRNTSKTTDGWVVAYQYGRMVSVKGWIKFSSAATGAWTKTVVATGLPVCNEDPTWFGVASIDYLTSNPVLGVNANGELYVDSRDESIAGKDSFLAGVYMASTEYV